MVILKLRKIYLVSTFDCRCKKIMCCQLLVNFYSFCSKAQNCCNIYFGDILTNFWSDWSTLLILCWLISLRLEDGRVQLSALAACVLCDESLSVTLKFSSVEKSEVYTMSNKLHWSRECKIRYKLFYTSTQDWIIKGFHELMILFGTKKIITTIYLKLWTLEFEAMMTKINEVWII